jgi:hypothetical protein
MLTLLWNGFIKVMGAVEASLNFSEHAGRFYHQLSDIR